MIRQIAIYIAISVVVSMGIGYGSGYYIASSKAERDVAAIRTILEKQEAKKAASRKAAEEYFRKEEESLKRMRKIKHKSY